MLRNATQLKDSQFPNAFLFEATLTPERLASTPKHILTASEYSKDASTALFKSYLENCGAKSVTVVKVTLLNYKKIIKDLSKLENIVGTFF